MSHDAPARRKKSLGSPGKIQAGKLGVYKGEFLVAQVGRLATAATCRRFGAIDATFKNGAWRGK